MTTLLIIATAVTAMLLVLIYWQASVCAKQRKARAEKYGGMDGVPDYADAPHPTGPHPRIRR